MFRSVSIVSMTIVNTTFACIFVLDLVGFLVNSTTYRAFLSHRATPSYHPYFSRNFPYQHLSTIHLGDFGGAPIYGTRSKARGQRRCKARHGAHHNAAGDAKGATSSSKNDHLVAMMNLMTIND